ncbi:MAG: UbiA family prenyltransferase, partial [Dehalococcoidia bacterium]|nr:UbiA family prenyltransferase [Dehalococcoidia bacterium]
MPVALGRFGYRLSAFLGFSRALQATLSIAQPAFAAIIALGALPPVDRMVIGFLAAFAGFFAVFALNDLLDVDLDRARFDHLRGFQGFDIDSAMSRHPLAQGQLGMHSGLAWVAGLALLGFAGAYVLSPMAAILFIIAALLEVVYCRLARITPLKFLVTGIMVGCGALAGWTAVTGETRASEMTVLFIWMFAWEIGGRNLVNDFADVEEDVRLGIKSVAVIYGPRLGACLKGSQHVIS